MNLLVKFIITNRLVRICLFTNQTANKEIIMQYYTNNFKYNILICQTLFATYCVFSETNDTLFVSPNSPGELPLHPTKITAANKNILWSIKIVAQCQEARDVNNVAAIAANASNAWDYTDFPEPALVGGYVAVYFPHPEWNRHANAYTTDIRPSSQEGQIWEFEVSTNIRGKVNLTFENIENVPEESEVWLIDEAVNIARNLRSLNRYAVAGCGAEHPKALKLVVGKPEFVKDMVADFQSTPFKYQLSQNFPNPFNPATTISFALPEIAEVTNKIYNLLGKEIVTLVSREQMEAGYHTRIWDGRNDKGQTVSSGVYLYHLQADGFSQIQKMTLLK
ncbi:MAG: T9SS type A sorting domain-containing protein [bacterium]